MTYKEWADSEALRKGQIILKLQGQGKSVVDIVDYFDYENMVVMEPNYCGLYRDCIKCHDVEELNCFFCGCPYFKFDDKGLTKRKDKVVYSTCVIDAIKGVEFVTENAIHQDCTDCSIPHRKEFVYREAQKIIKVVKERYEN